MGDAKIIWNRSYILKGRYRVVASVLAVDKSEKFPDGIKAKFVLIDLDNNVPRLLVDNHAPFGFHIHTTLPEDSENRVELDVKNFGDAYDEFLKQVERVLKNEEQDIKDNV